MPFGAHPQGPSLCKKTDRKCFPTHPQHPLLKRFQTEPEPQTPALLVFAPKTYKKPNALRFEVRADRHHSRTRSTICSLHVTPESPSRHEPNLHSWHTNPEKSYVHRASLSPSGAFVLSFFFCFCAFCSCFRACLRACLLCLLLSVLAFNSVLAFVRALNSVLVFSNSKSAVGVCFRAFVRAFSAGQLFCLRACFRACFRACLPSVLVLSCFFRSICASDRFVLPIDSSFRAFVLCAACASCFSAVLLFCFRACLLSVLVLSVFCAFVLSIFRSIRAFDRFVLSCFVLPVLPAALCCLLVLSCFRIRNRLLVCAGTDGTAAPAPTPTAHPTNTDRA